MIRSAPLLLLLAVLAGIGEAHAAGFPTEPSPAVAQPAPPPLPQEPDRWLPFRVFDWRDGLAQPVNSLAIDRQGYLWAGSQDGAFVYNGHTWRRVDLPTDPPDTPVIRVLAARDGSLWLSTRTRGIFRLFNGIWSRFQPAPPPSGTLFATSFVETAHAGGAVVWVGTNRGLSRCISESCRPVPALQGVSVRALVPTRDGAGQMALWAATERGLVRLDRIETAPVLAPLLFDQRNVLPDGSVRSLAETVAADGRRSLWVGTDRGLARLRDDHWTRYDHSAGFPEASVIALHPGRWEGRKVVWAATFGGGLVRIDEEHGRWQVIGTAAGLPADYLYSLFSMDAGTDEPALWVATTAGLARIDRTRWHAIDSRAGLPSDTVISAGESLFPDGRTTYWVGTANGTVRLTEHGWEPFLPFPGSPSPVVLDIAASREKGESDIWMSTAQGIFRFSGGAWNLALQPGQAYFLEVIPAPGGDEVWAFFAGSIRRLTKGKWEIFHPGADGLPGREVISLEWTRIGESQYALWASTDEGVARWTGQRWQPVAVPCLPHPAVLALRALTDAEGRVWLWLGTRKGAARIRLEKGEAVPGSCQSLTAEIHPRLSHPWVSQILSDQAGRIYLFSDKGVVRLTVPPGGSLDGARLETFDTEDGLPGINSTRASFRDHRGRIWSGSSAGIAIFDPAYEPHRAGLPPPAPLRIERFLINGRERPPTSGFALLPGEKRLEIEYALLSFEHEHAVRFRTQLVGLEDRPTGWTRDARVLYDRIPPGSYTFRVWGRDGDGVVSGPAELRFRVLPPPWRTSWAFALYALALAGLIYGTGRIRVRALARRAAQLEDLVAERTRDLAEANRRLELASFTDPLTGLHNRRYLASTIRPDVVQAVRNHREPFGDPRHRDLIIYLLDLDHFKRLNDREGHDAGDAVLTETARRLRGVLRSSDLVVRWGGEEILIVSRWADREAGTLLAQRLLEAIGGRPFLTGVDRTAIVTCSVGWAPFPWCTEDPDAVLFEEVLSLSDHALYLAKRKGRNRAVGVLPGAAAAEEVAERILREDAPLHSLEGMEVELLWSEGPAVATDDRTASASRSA